MSGFDVTGPGALPRARLVGESAAPATSSDGEGGEESFGGVLSGVLAEVNRLGSQTKDTAAALARGEPVEVHELMVAAGKSEVAFNIMIEVRNKLLEAWQTLQRSVR